jgi:hypothetical protein
MATICAAPDVWAPDRLTVERRMQHALRVINGPGWRQRLVAFAGDVEERDLTAAVRAAMRKERRQHCPS